MRNFVIGTAGHVDHGKTCLVRALTGIDTDRLAEEKRRGITIENGFAYISLPSVGRVGIIDVPGHSRYVGNMLAGVCGIDFALLVVAADDGVMAQTREHLEILSFMGVKHGMVAVTKADRADDRMADIKRGIADMTRGTFLENAEIAVVSIYDTQSVERLRACLDEKLAQTAQDYESTQTAAGFAEERHGEAVSRPADCRSGTAPGSFRMCIDRAFTLKGRGTVVTGTVLEGSAGPGTPVELVLLGRPVRIRSIQVYGGCVDRAVVGQRAAFCLAGAGKEEVRRGEVLASRGSMEPASYFEAGVTVSAASPYHIKHDSRIHLYIGSDFAEARILMNKRRGLGPGESDNVRIKLDRAVAAKPGDRFVLRFHSPVVTVGGGMVTSLGSKGCNEVKGCRDTRRNPNINKSESSGPAPKKKVSDGNGSELPDTCANPDDAVYDRALEMFRRERLRIYSMDDIMQELQGSGGRRAALRRLCRENQAVGLGGDMYMSYEGVKSGMEAVNVLTHEKGCFTLAEFRDKLNISRGDALKILEYFDASGLTRREGNVRVLK